MVYSNKKKSGQSNKLVIVLVVFILFGVFCIFYNKKSNTVLSNNALVKTGDSASDETTTVSETEAPEKIDLRAKATASTVNFGEDVLSSSGVLIDMQTNEIIAQKNADTRMYPASLTKIMTVGTALDYIINLDDTYTLPEFIFQDLYDQNASLAGFQPNENIKIKDYLYGAILPSGADATIGLSMYISGTEASFVDLMNRKLNDIGIADTTHFANTSGLHNESHYTTALDMGVILNQAWENPTFREIFTAHSYTTEPTNLNAEGISLSSTLFSRITGTEVPGVTILGGKTGFTDEAGYCLATIAEKDGKEYMLITADAAENPDVSYPNINDAITIYTNYLK